MGSRTRRQSRNKQPLHKDGQFVHEKPVALGVCGQYSRLAPATHLHELQEQREPVTSKTDCITSRTAETLLARRSFTAEYANSAEMSTFSCPLRSLRKLFTH